MEDELSFMELVLKLFLWGTNLNITSNFLPPIIDGNKIQMGEYYRLVMETYGKYCIYHKRFSQEDWQKWPEDIMYDDLFITLKRLEANERPVYEHHFSINYLINICFSLKYNKAPPETFNGKEIDLEEEYIFDKPFNSFSSYVCIERDGTIISTEDLEQILINLINSKTKDWTAEQNLCYIQSQEKTI